jgi:hypothetical protein
MKILTCLLMILIFSGCASWTPEEREAFARAMSNMQQNLPKQTSCITNGSSVVGYYTSCSTY